MDPDESPETCAIRELKEETGYIGELVSDRSFQASPVMFNGMIALIDCFHQFLYCATVVSMVLNILCIAFYTVAYYVLSHAVRALLEIKIEIGSFKPLSGAELVALRTYMYHNFRGDYRVIEKIIDIVESTNVILKDVVLEAFHTVTATLQSLTNTVWFYLRLHAVFLLINICCALFNSRTRGLLVLHDVLVHVD
jgi:8-oxo-dGTP pyrophosphatase MutT (NUDIX family)